MDHDEIKEQCHEAIDRLRILLACTAPELCARFCDEAYVAGGAISSLIRGETPKDYDIFLRTTGLAMELSSALAEKAQHSTDRALSFDVDGQMIQLVYAHVGEPETMVSEFDFLHCKGYYAYGNRVLVVPEETREAAENSMLLYVPVANPVRSFWRAIKLEQRGWTLPQDTVLQIVREIQKLDLSTAEAIAEELSLWY